MKNHLEQRKPNSQRRGIAPSRRIGDYEILEEIGRGGMGVVFRAQHVFLDQIVALKVLPLKHVTDAAAVQRFRGEMRSAGRLNHPNIVRAYNAGEDRGTQFLATEFVEGTTLGKLVDEGGTLSVGAACELIRQAARGLSYVHESGLVHRDIKPANLMLASSGTVKILDLGLAQLQMAGLSNEGTQAGMVIGTAEFMAPEQWVDPGTVDIRADIYGLGGTLFYLLTGRAPLAADALAGGLDKQADCPAPAAFCVSAFRTDCPETLDEVIRSMMAEDADERFDTPGDVVKALKPFAKPDEVTALLDDSERASHRRPLEPLTKEQSSVIGSRDDTLHSAPGPSVSSQTQASTSRPPAWLFPSLGLAIVVLLGGIASVALLFHFGSSNAAPPKQTTSADVARLERCAFEVCTLPGLNGRWWFDETPWLLPFVRHAIGQELTAEKPSLQLPAGDRSENSPLLDPNPLTVQNWLLKLVSQSRDRWTKPQRSLADDLLSLSQEDLVDTELAARLAIRLDQFQRELGETRTWSPMDLNTCAVLQHKIAAVTNNRELAKQAARHYESASAAYAQAEVNASWLRARCLVDGGLLHAQVLKNYTEAQRCFREARTVPDVPVLLQVEAWVDEAIAHALASHYGDAASGLDHALELLQSSSPGLSNHPFAAHVHERYAWILMDQWNVRKANVQFKEARNIRFDNYWKSHNDFAQIFVFHNDHGQAMAERYCGDVKIARAQYDVVIGEVEKALQKAETAPDGPGLQRFRRDLRERLSNSCERRADCEFYQGAASDAAVDLTEAARLYAVARDMADDPAVRIAMSTKRAITLALDDKLVEAGRELKNEGAAERVVIGSQENRVRLLRKLATAILESKKRDPSSGTQALREMLEDLDFDSARPAHLRREILELNLFAAERLTATQLGDKKLANSAAADAAYLVQLAAGIPQRDQMLVYLRRYFDLAIEALSEIAPERAAAAVLASRGQQPTSEATVVLFHFGPHAGRAIVRPAGRPSVCFTLPFGRAEVKAAGMAPNSRLRLPDALVEFIVREQSTGTAVVVSWDDAAVWAKPDTALTAEDWPFAHQLDLASFQAPAG